MSAALLACVHVADTRKWTVSRGSDQKVGEMPGGGSTASQSLTTLKQRLTERSSMRPLIGSPSFAVPLDRKETSEQSKYETSPSSCIDDLIVFSFLSKQTRPKQVSMFD